MLAVQGIPPVPPVPPPGSELSIGGSLEGIAAIVLLLGAGLIVAERIVAQGREPDRLQR
jgi:hypothetical protein